MLDLPLKILLVDDDPDILELLEYNLSKEGYSIRTAENGLEGIKVAEEFSPDLILMDIMMPVMDGIEAGRIIRQNKDLKRTLLVFLTARNEEYSEVAAFELGADDYIIKPLKPRALISRIKAITQRNSVEGVDESDIILEDLIINRKKYSITIKEQSWTLPKKEFDLLLFFVNHQNRVYTREEILLNVWGKGVHVTERTVDVHIRKIREKIGDDYIRTVKGVGYLFSRS